MHDLVYYYPEGHEAHAQSGHPERPDRIGAIRRALERYGWWQAYPQVGAAELPESVLLAIHSPAYLERVQAASRAGAPLDGDTYTTPVTWDLARRSAGGALAVGRAVWRREARSGFALCRPPGHHATRDRGMGFCVLNNVALAAQLLLEQEGARRLAIIDLDLHHGNGTQDIFYQCEEVFYLSIHQSPLYPGTGMLEETGAGAGRGTNANFPLVPGSGDTAFHTLLEELILPLLDRFSPQMLLLSIGFDPHWRDPLGHLRLSARGMGEMVRGLAAWAEEHAGGRIALFLEGGYDLEAAAACAQASIAALLAQPWEDPLGPPPRGELNGWRSLIPKAREVFDLN